MKEEFTKLFSPFSGKHEELIPLLQKVQEHFGYLSDEAMLAVGQFLAVPESKVFATATFYAQFRFKPKGRMHIMACRGTACHVKGIPRILDEIEKQIGIKEGETSADLEYSLESVACIGACSLAPCIVINNKVEADLTPMKIESLFKK
jgi:NADH-quinone oxidoreductase subunit E